MLIDCHPAPSGGEYLADIASECVVSSHTHCTRNDVREPRVMPAPVVYLPAQKVTGHASVLHGCMHPHRLVPQRCWEVQSRGCGIHNRDWFLAGAGVRHHNGPKAAVMQEDNESWASSSSLSNSSISESDSSESIGSTLSLHWTGSGARSCRLPRSVACSSNTADLKPFLPHGWGWELG
jgi:hypothetical protein